MISKGPEEYRDAPAQTRHRMVYEIGDEGVGKLLAASFAVRGCTDVRTDAAFAWTREYLFRAGLEENPDGDVQLSMPDSAILDCLSAKPESERSNVDASGEGASMLDEAIAAICGCYLAAEAIKEVIGYGERGSLEEALRAAL